MTDNNTPMDSFATRLGFILVSAGCAIGIGNVWKFPYLCGQFGGAAFILIYLVFLLIMGIPVMVCEFAIGRSSRRSAARSFDVLEPPGTRWHHFKWISIVGCYMLMMYYTTVTGWMLYYCYLHLKGAFTGASTQAVAAAFGSMLGSAPTMLLWMAVACFLGFAVCYFGIKDGVERISKFMMVALLLLMIVLAVHSVFLEGAEKGIRFYLVPNFETLDRLGWGNVIFAAMSQAFFTLSIGIGAMLIFGAYLPPGRSLFGEAVTITALDTFVALMAGFIIIPACFAYGIKPDAGPSLIFLTIPNLFARMPGGQLWGSCFFVFLSLPRDLPQHPLCTGLQPVVRFPAAGPRHGSARPGGFHRLQQSPAPRQPRLRALLHQEERLDLGKLPAGSERRRGRQDALFRPAIPDVRAARLHPDHLSERLLRHVRQTGHGRADQMALRGCLLFALHLVRCLRRTLAQHGKALKRQFHIVTKELSSGQPAGRKLLPDFYFIFIPAGSVLF